MITKLLHATLFGIGAIAAFPALQPAHAFCGFFVGKADATLFNEASKVILVRNEDRTVISMANDYRGPLNEFAIVVPVPQVLQRSQINVGDPKLFDRIDAYSAPRLAEYFDANPCDRRRMMELSARASAPLPASAPAKAMRDQALGVTVEAQYTVGEYDIVILSARESDGLETWLQQSGYRIPKGASAALQPYIRQNLKFFVAKVNLKEQAKTGVTYLRPLQFAFESEKFMLPIRLGMINAQGPQDLIVFALTKGGRVESTNYRTVKLPANVDVPTHVKGDFARFYKALFDEQARKEAHRVLFTEYFWDMSWCDPCAADPLTPAELKSAGVFWLDADDAPPVSGAIGVSPTPGAAPVAPVMRNRRLPPNGQPVMLTRLHVRYARDTFPEDLMFQETKDRQNFQTRYVIRHAWKGDVNACDEAKSYVTQLPVRFEHEAQTLATLTGWDIAEVRKQMELPASVMPASGSKAWWENLWK